MVFSRLLARRVKDLLQPWLREELELELKLGLVRSHASATNLRFDAAALNQLLGESSRLSFEDVTVEHMAIRFSNWSDTAFTIEVRGVHGTLSTEMELKDQRGRRPPSNWEAEALEDMKKTLYAIDPEGTTLHDILEGISVEPSNRSRLTTSFLNLILRHCHLQMSDINLLVQFRTGNESFACFSKLKELNVESEFFDHGCLLRSLVGAVILPLKKSSVIVTGNRLKMGFRSKDYSNRVFYSRDLFTCFKLNELQIVDFNFHVPELSISVSPVDLPLLMALSELSSKDSPRSRTGRQLWKLAASKIGQVVSPPSLSLHKSITVVILWLRYANAYECLLSLVGYSTHHLLKKSAAKMSKDREFLTSVKHQLKAISDIEGKLPAEAVAQARRIARYKAALKVQRAVDSKAESFVKSRFGFFCKMLLLLAYMWRVICKSFYSTLHFIRLRKTRTHETEVDGSLAMLCDYPCPQHCFSLNLGKISLIVSPINAEPSVTEKLESYMGISFSELRSFCISFDALLLIYEEDICEKSLSVSCGGLQIKTSSIEGHLTERVKDMTTILWVEPADIFVLPESSRTFTTDHAEGACDSYLENFLKEMWLNWKKDCMKFEESEMEYSESPCFLCETRNYLVCPEFKNPDCGFQKCNMALGRLNLVLDYSSILSTSLLISQIQRVLCKSRDSGTTTRASRSPRTVENPPEISSASNYMLYTSEVKSAMLTKLPEKCLQLGVLLAGPHIQISLRKEGIHSGSEDSNYKFRPNDICFTFDVQNIEVAIWPTSASKLAPYSGLQGSHDVELECLRLKKPLKVDVPKTVNENYTSQGEISLNSYLRIGGLNGHFRDLAEKLESQILVLEPIVVQLSFVREYLHSLSTTVIAFSAALCGVAQGFTVLAYMDELYVFSKMILGLFSAVSIAINRYDSISCVPFQEFMRQDMMLAETTAEDTTPKGPPIIYKHTILSVNGTFKLPSVDIVLHTSRISNNSESMHTLDALSREKLDNDLPDCGIWISIRKACLKISSEEGKLEVLANFCRFLSVIFRYQNHRGESMDQPELRNLLQQAVNCLYELSLSDCKFTLWFALPQNASSSGSVSNANASSFGSNTLMENSSLITDPETSSLQSISMVQNLGLASKIVSPASSHCLLINVVLSEIFMVNCLLKNPLVAAHQLNEVLLSLSVEEEFQMVSCGIQGFCLFLEPTALAAFGRCFSWYLHFGTNLLSDRRIEKAVHSVDATRQNNPFGNQVSEEMLHTSAKWELPESIIINLSHVSFVVIEEEHGGIREVVLEVNAHLKLELANMRRILVFDLSRLSILSQTFHEDMKSEIQMSKFSSVPSNSESPPSKAGAPPAFQCNQDWIYPADITSCTREPVSPKELSENSFISEASCLDHRSYILKHLAISISVEKPSGSENGPLILNRAWVGSGSVSGFDVTVSLAEIQMILSTAESFSGIFEKETTSELKQKLSSSNQESENNFEEMIPNGAIVAIQDVHQHMYFAVEGEENNYNLAGAFHYSLVGERALFKVKYDNQRRWKSPVSWFSLISLHAKTNSGEPLRLNCRPRSGFVDISSTDDSNWALWKMLPCEHENYMDDVDWEPHKQLVKNTFYLVNKKNDRAVAFVDGVPEFVTNSGNPFKMKVFHDLHLPPEDGYPAQASGTDHQQEIGSGEIQSHPWINISIDKVTFSIVHELLNRREVFPILRGCVDNIQLLVQILSTKARVINTSSAAIYYYDAQTNFWRELVRPVEISIFYRSSLHAQQKAPIHFYCRTKELEISIAEVSLDILLFIIGELNLAGPFSVRSSLILAKSCKVENKSGLSLICDFYNKRSVTIAGKQSSSIFLRHSTIQDQLSETTSVVSIQLSVPGSFSTSPISFSHIEDQSLAWRTRIVSPKDSRSYPGPFIVVDISTKTKDGLSIVVSPLIRIHNGTEFPLELRFQRPQENKKEFATWVLKSGDTLDDSMTMLDAINLSGGFKKALMSLSVGNFLLSFRPEVSEGLIDMENPLSVEWSDDLKGGKAVLLSGIFDKLYYKVRKAISIESVNCSFSTVNCSLISEDGHVSKMHFLVQCIRREVPVMQPGNNGDGPESSTVALQEQKEIFLLPTVRISNLLHSEIHVFLTETDLSTTSCNSDNIRKQATMSSGSAVNFYVNPATIYFNVTLTAFSSSCKPVNSGDWAKRLRKEKDGVHSLDIDLDFGGGKYFASLRLSRGDQGILEAAIFTPYSLKNDSDFSLFFCELNQKPLSRDEVGKYGDNIPPELGLLLPPKSTESWFLKSNKIRLKLLENRASEALLHLDVLSGAAEISLEAEEGDGLQYITKFGVCVESSLSTAVIPSRTVAVAPRYVVLNKSEESITVRQCYLQDDTAGTILIKSKQRTTLKLCDGIGKRKEYSLFENFIRKHKDDNDDSILFVQFRLNNLELGWSGPICIASLGRFFLKFRKHSNQATVSENNIAEIAVVHVVEEGSTFVLQFQTPPNISLPYRIENHLRNASLTYYQKDLSEHEVLGSECSVDYVWDDLTLPHKLVIQINGLHLLREIKLDKVRSWKPLFKTRQYGGLTSHLGWAETFGDQRTSFGKLNEIEMVKLGYEIYADGPTRVLRVCEFSDSHQGDSVSRSSAKIQLRVSQFAVHLLEVERQDVTRSGPSVYTPIIVARLGNINLDSVVADRQMYNQITIEAVNVDEKWVGAPFAAMLRRHQLDHDSNDPVLKIVFVLLSVSSEVKQVRYSSIVLQPLDLNLDEETLMRIVPFWRSSLSESTQSQQFYFDHFEIHPIKIIANFLPGDSYASYTSAQEALRSLLHSVVKVPAISNKVLELNGVLVTHALITMRELLIKCAQHYSWHAMRAICIAKGSPYLPPFCASIFDDLASSSLDVFFDPSRGLRNLPGLTFGTFKLISKCIDGKGFSGTKRYFGDLGKTLRTAGSNVLFATVTEISDSVLKGAETSGFNGMMSGFHQGILHLAMEPSLLGNALMEGGPDRKIKLDRSPGVDELYIEGYLQAMLDTMYKQEYLRVRVIDNQVFLKNLPPNSSLIEEIMDRVRGFLVSKALLKGDSSTTSQPLRHLRGDSEWKFGPTVLTLCEHLFVSFAIRMLRKQSGQFIAGIKLKREKANMDQAIVPLEEGREKVKLTWKWGVGRFVFSTMLAYIDGRLCRCIPNSVARRIVSGFLLSFLDKNDNP